MFEDARYLHEVKLFDCLQLGHGEKCASVWGADFSMSASRDLSTGPGLWSHLPLVGGKMKGLSMSVVGRCSSCRACSGITSTVVGVGDRR